MTSDPVDLGLPLDSAGAVRAIHARPSRSYRHEWWRESLRDRFWVLPAFLMVLGAALAVLTAEASKVGWFDGWPTGLKVSPASSQNILGLVATSTLTFVGVVFTITLVALQLASAQLSPRVIRTFVRSFVTRLTFGMFLATFTFSVVVLVLEGALRSDQAESRAVTAALFLVMASLIVFVVYVSATMKLLQVNWVLTVVANETRHAIDTTFPPEPAYTAVTPPALVADPVLVGLDGGRTLGTRIGVLLSLDQGGLVELAQRHGCVVQLLHRVGEYLPVGEPAFALHGGTAPPAAELLRCLHLGRARTLHQDPAYGIRQLVDVAIQALSPALNQPTTAVHTIDRLEDLLLRIAARPARTGVWTDGAGVARLIEPVDDWAYLVNAAFSEITYYGTGSVQVSRRLVACYPSMIEKIRLELRPPLQIRLADLLAAAADFPTETDRAVALLPDRRGLG